MKDRSVQELFLKQERELEDAFHREWKKGAWKARSMNKKRRRGNTREIIEQEGVGPESDVEVQV